MAPSNHLNIVTVIVCTGVFWRAWCGHGLRASIVLVGGSAVVNRVDKMLINYSGFNDLIANFF